MTCLPFSNFFLFKGFCFPIKSEGLFSSVQINNELTFIYNVYLFSKNSPIHKVNEVLPIPCFSEIIAFLSFLKENKID
jgi:hypothetical protein